MSLREQTRSRRGNNEERMHEQIEYHERMRILNNILNRSEQTIQHEVEIEPEKEVVEIQEEETDGKKQRELSAKTYRYTIE